MWSLLTLRIYLQNHGFICVDPDVGSTENTELISLHFCNSVDIKHSFDSGDAKFISSYRTLFDLTVAIIVHLFVIVYGIYLL